MSLAGGEPLTSDECWETSVLHRVITLRSSIVSFPRERIWPGEHDYSTHLIFMSTYSAATPPIFNYSAPSVYSFYRVTWPCETIVLRCIVGSEFNSTILVSWTSVRACEPCCKTSVGLTRVKQPNLDPLTQKKNTQKCLKRASLGQNKTTSESIQTCSFKDFACFHTRQYIWLVHSAAVHVRARNQFGCLPYLMMK